MAFFKFRKGGEDASAPAQPGQPESVEAMRRRARQRLIGAAVLVLAGVIGFPLVFDTQPRPIAVDIPIDIPDRAKAKPVVAAAPVAGLAERAEGTPPTTASPAQAAPVAAAAPVAPVPVAAPAPAPVAAAPSAPSASAKPASAPAKVAAKPEPKDKPEAQAAAKPAGDGERAKALLEGKPAASASASAAATDGRFVVQVGAFADPAKAAAARSKLEKAGLKTYTHVAETKEGKRTRVRVGPFPTRGEADKAAAKVKGLELPASVLTL